MAHVAAESLQGVLGATFEYAFTDAGDARAYKVERRRRIKWRDERQLAGVAALCITLVVYYAAIGGWTNASVAVLLLGLFVFMPDLQWRLLNRYTRLRLTVHPGWIGIAEESNRKQLFSRPFSDLVRASRVKSIEWQDGSCLIRRKWFVFRPTYIDGRLLAQEGAIEAICEWANRNDVGMNGTVPILAAE